MGAMKDTVRVALPDSYIRIVPQEVNFNDKGRQFQRQRQTLHNVSPASASGPGRETTRPRKSAKRDAPGCDPVVKVHLFKYHAWRHIEPGSAFDCQSTIHPREFCRKEQMRREQIQNGERGRRDGKIGQVGPIHNSHDQPEGP